jgi:purine-binding chemotaxis protein CheW
VPESPAARLVCFYLDDQELGVAITEVKETIEVRPITRVFLVPDFIAGLINLRGDVVAVIDLARLLGLPRRRATADARIVILRGRSPGKPVVAGLLVDRLSEVRDVEADALHAPPATLSTEAARFLLGVARAENHPLLVLDLEHVFDSDKLKTFRRQG